MKARIIECEQGTEEWLHARLGVPTASEFATVMSEGRSDGVMSNAMIDALVKSGCTTAQLAAAVKAAKCKNSNPAAMRTKYLRQLAGEIITGEPTEGMTNVHMERGKDQEADARRVYAFMEGVSPLQVGFITDGEKGCSPDSLIGDNGGLEIKAALPHIQIERLFKNELPPEYKAQVQGGIWICEREWWDFVSYCPKFPLLIKRVYRDEPYIEKMGAAVRAFNEELAALIDSIRGLIDPSHVKKQFVTSANMMAG